MVHGEHYLDVGGIFKMVFRSNSDMRRNIGESKTRLPFESNERKNTREEIKMHLGDTKRQCKH